MCYTKSARAIGGVGLAKWRYTNRGLQRLGLILQKARVMKGWDLRRTQEETIRYETSQYGPGESLPSDLGVSYSTINRYESGLVKRVIDPRVLGVLIDVLQPINPSSKKPYTIQDLLYIAMEIELHQKDSSVKNLLDQFRELLVSEKSLKIEDREQALEQVRYLSSFGEEVGSESDKKNVKTMIRALKGMITELPATSNLVEEGTNVLLKVAKKLEIE